MESQLVPIYFTTYNIQSNLYIEITLGTKKKCQVWLYLIYYCSNFKQNCKVVHYYAQYSSTASVV